MSSQTPVTYLQAHGLSKNFGHVRALRDVSLEVNDNEILAIVGDNGAGKSTLTKILSGVHQPDQGEIQINGQPVRISNPRKAQELGIATVFQNLALVDCRDVAANLYLGREPTRWRFLVDRRKMLDDSRQVISRLRVTIPSVTAEAGQLSGGQRQSIAIGRAASQNARVIIMDEPTAALGVKESRKVLDLILQLKASGTTVVVISHNMRHVFSVADRIMVLRHGQLVGIRRKQETTPDEIVKMIVGVDIL
jgi:ABC-type sugar transport system ATPase subunit